jgi:hypothetical protein
MGGFLLIALAIPTAFGNGGVVFGIGYLVVTLVHTGLFMQSSRQRIISAVTRLGPFNLITAGLLLVAGFTPGGVRVVLFALGFVLHWITPFLIPQSSFTIRAGHFVERHGLILLIALGESVVAVGIGLGAIELPIGRIAAALLGLALTAALWWLYFSGDEERAEAALDVAAGSRKPWLALNAFGYAFVPIPRRHRPGRRRTQTGGRPLQRAIDGVGCGLPRGGRCHLPGRPRPISVADPRALRAPDTSAGPARHHDDVHRAAHDAGRPAGCARRRAGRRKYCRNARRL